jgi:hypothetical protein
MDRFFQEDPYRTHKVLPLLTYGLMRKCAERAFTLDDSIDHGKIEATVGNFLLRLVLPKAEPAKPRKIEIKGIIEVLLRTEKEESIS